METNEVPAVGPFNRTESDTQTIQDAIDQEKSQEVWGATPRGGFEPTVQAYCGPLAHGDRGIEFTTLVMPHNNGSPFEVRWYLTKTPGVVPRHKNGVDYACISAAVKNMQP